MHVYTLNYLTVLSFFMHISEIKFSVFVFFWLVKRHLKLKTVNSLLIVYIKSCRVACKRSVAPIGCVHVLSFSHRLSNLYLLLYIECTILV